MAVIPQKRKCTNQVASAQDVLEMGSHRVVLHGHEEGVEDNTDGDGKVNKWVHDNQVDDMLDLQPKWKALPDEEDVGKFVPAGRALPLRLLQFCTTRNKVVEEEGLGACNIFKK